MKSLVDIREIENIQQLDNEYAFQKALLLDRKLRLMVKENIELKPIHNQLFELIRDYEEKYWSDSDKITDAQVEESDKAEELVNAEQKFIHERKESIRKKLKAFDMTQQDLGTLLGHPKSYMSELINGVSQFTLKDLVIIHQTLGVSLETLIPTYLQEETKNKVRASLTKLNKPKLSLRNKDLMMG